MQHFILNSCLLFTNRCKSICLTLYYIRFLDLLYYFNCNLPKLTTARTMRVFSFSNYPAYFAIIITNMRLLIFLFTFSSLSSIAQKNYVYYTPVNTPPSIKSTYYESLNPQYLAEDLAWLLSCATSQSWKPAPFNNNNKGIILKLNDELLDENNETGHISISKSTITISAKYATGLSYAMYSWLQQLGFKFYLPGNNWMVIPKIKNLYQHPLNKTFSPGFQMRLFHASGGIFPVKDIDDSAKNRNTWFAWLRRNRMGCDYLRIDGHRGELFNQMNKAVIESDSNIIAPIAGKRKYNIEAKLDPTYSKGVTLFTNWLVTQFEKEKQNTANWLPFKIYQSGDLGDGLNYCHTPACKAQFSSVSDQAFYIMNIAAKKIKTVDKRAGISTLAYTERADTPTITIQPNVHVMIVASAFQRITTASELLQRWAKKTSNISLYDFLNIGVWQYDHPFFNLTDYLSFLQLNKHLNVQGLTMETSYSSLAAGIPMYVILQYLADPLHFEQNQLTTLCKDMFGTAAPEIEQLFSLWYQSDVHLRTNIDRPTFYPDELATFISLIKQAEKRNSLTTQQKQRINQLKPYIAYLCGAYELFQNPKIKEDNEANKEYRQQKAEELLQLTWSQYDNLTFHNTQLNELLKKFTSHPEKWDFKKNISAQINHLSTDFANNLFKKYAAQFQSPSSFDFKISPNIWNDIAEQAADSIRIESIDEQAIPSFIYPLMIFTSKPTTISVSVHIKEKIIKRADAAPVALTSVERKDYTFIKTHFVTGEMQDTIFYFNLPAAGNYRLFLGRFQQAPLQWTIYSTGALVYINKKNIIHNAIKLIDETQPKYSNYRLGIYAPKPFEFQEMFPVKNTAIFSSNENKSSVNKFSDNPYRYSLTLHNNREPSIIYYENEVMRWPTIIMNTPPYFFFVK